MIEILKYDKFYIGSLGGWTYIIDTTINKCPNIKVSDIVSINNIKYKIVKLEWFMKSFDIKGEVVSLVIEPLKAK